MKRTLDFGSYVSISAGLALAASSFTMLAALLGLANPTGALLSIPIAGALLTVVAASIGSLASLFPAAPGISVYLGKAFGGSSAIIVVLMYIAVFGCLVGGESYLLSQVTAVLGYHLPSNLLAVGALSLVMLGHLLGMEVPLKIQIATTVAVIACVVLLVSFSLFGDSGKTIQWSLTEATVPKTDLATTIGMGVFLFIGFEWVTPLGRMPKHYRYMVPWAMPVAILLLTVVYTAFGIALLVNFPATVISGSKVPQFLLARVIGSPFGVALAIGMSVFAMINTFNAGLLGSARLVYGLAREGSFPAFLSRISLDTGAPYAAIITTGALALITAVGICQFDLTVVAVSFAAALECFIYAAVMFAWIQLQHKSKGKDIFRSPFPKVVQLLVGCIMPVLGLGALFADQEYAIEALVFFLVSMLVIVGTSFALTSNRRARAPIGA